MEEILNHLSSIKDLRVASRTSMEKYRESTLQTKQIGSELNVDYLLETSVFKSANRIRVITQLIDTKTDDHIWSQQYDRELNDVFGVMSDMALEVVSKVKVAISPDVQKSIESVPTRNLEAYDLYLKANNIGLHFSDYPFETDVNTAIHLYSQAIKLDSNFAEAYVGLAERLYSIRYRGPPDKLWKDSVFALINRAINIKPFLSTAYSLKARLYGDLFNFDAVEENLKLALKYNPNNTDALRYLGDRELLKGDYNKYADYETKYYKIYLANPQERDYEMQSASFFLDYGDTLKAENILKEIIETKPAIVGANYQLIRIASCQGRIKKAMKYLQNVIRLDPTNLNLITYFGFLFGDYKKSEQNYRQLEKTYSNYKNTYMQITFLHRLGFAMVKNGKTEEGNKIIQKELQRLNDAIEKRPDLNSTHGYYYDIACIYAYQGKKDEAIKYLTLARDNKLNGAWFQLWYALRDPMFENIREDARFKKLINDEIQERYKFQQVFRHKVDSMNAVSELKWMKEK